MVRGLVLALAALVALAGAAAAQPVPKRLLISTYDERIEDAVRRWWPGFPWPSWWKAQLFQESRLDPAAVSPAGARGLAQIMPATFRELKAQTGLAAATPHDLAAIDLGAYYMARLTRSWRPDGRSPRERHLLALASYNAGLGSILKAQARCDGAVHWAAIQPCLAQVTGPRNAAETTGYVRLVPQWQAMVERAWGRP